MLLSARFHQNCQAAFGCCDYLWVKCYIVTFIVIYIYLCMISCGLGPIKAKWQTRTLFLFSIYDICLDWK